MRDLLLGCTMLVSALVASCSASPSPSGPIASTEPSPESADGSSDAPPPEQGGDRLPFSAAEVDALFKRSDCVGCHNARNDGPDMSSITNLANVPSGSARGGPSPCKESRFRLLLAPGDHAASLVFHKVAGTHDCGGKMPRGGAQPFSPTELARFALYIDSLE